MESPTPIAIMQGSGVFGQLCWGLDEEVEEVVDDDDDEDRGSRSSSRI